jgi:hypothetical protein
VVIPAKVTKSINTSRISSPTGCRAAIASQIDDVTSTLLSRHIEKKLHHLILFFNWSAMLVLIFKIVSFTVFLLTGKLKDFSFVENLKKTEWST